MSWAEIKAALNSTLGTDDFLPLDQLFGGYVEFTENGTFTVPPKVTEIWITACAGGGSGSVIHKVGQANDAGSGGGGGAAIENKKFTVVPGQVISITVGKGGTVNSSESYGNDGTETKIGELETLNGGKGANTVIGTAAHLGGIGGSGDAAKGIKAGGNGGAPNCNGMPGLKGQGGYAGNLSPIGFNEQPGDLPGGGGGSLGPGGSSIPNSTANRIANFDDSTPGKYGGGGAGGGNGNASAGGDGIVCIGWGPLGRATLVARNFD